MKNGAMMAPQDWVLNALAISPPERLQGLREKGSQGNKTKLPK